MMNLGAKMGASGAVLRIPNAPILLSSNKTPTQQSLPRTCLCSVRSSNKGRRFSWLSVRHGGSSVLAYLPSSSSASSSPNTGSTKLYVSGLSFRTTEESLRKAFQNFGQLVDVNLVMDKIANRPRGFAFIHYATEEESQKAIEGMHGKFLDGRVIFVEVAKSRSELHQGLKQNRRQF
ncbi:organelle RRM domain-containing protein 6, chloroplastic-like isoform X1 [Corylus avellana]|uniref:organelle RRM domain-containing protein 6, chloroplastic-like isoform X1 n=1 Tax=Corylus avellana TaxID=13451 RepID=UPI00286AE47C|nr:organelle RRM domain-containing protein 6, chloroplastic-like isoform X1 [Corylus avellana]